MNSTQLLLLGLLVWFAMSNKSKDTRNVILVIVGILCFCILDGTEGITDAEIEKGMGVVGFVLVLIALVAIVAAVASSSGAEAASE